MSDDKDLPATDPHHSSESRPGNHEWAEQGGVEHWVHEAIAAQEEYLKRRRSCSPDRWPGGFVLHKYATFGVLSADRRIDRAHTYSGCTECRVTETQEDYAIRTAARKEVTAPTPQPPPPPRADHQMGE